MIVRPDFNPKMRYFCNAGAHFLRTRHTNPSLADKSGLFLQTAGTANCRCLKG